MSGVLKAVGSVVSSAVSWVGDAISSVADFVVDGILSPIADFAGGFIDGFLENPFTSIAKIAAAVSGQPWVIALVNGAATAIEGGGLGDVLLSTAGSYISSSLGSQLNSFIGGAGSTAVPISAGLEGVTLTPPTNFVSEVLGNQFVKEIVGSGVSGAANAIIYGEDPVEAFLKGGVTAGISAGLGQIQDYLGFDTLTSNISGSTDSASLADTVLNVVGAGMQSFLAEGEVNPEAIANAVTRGFITSDIVNDLAEALGVGYFEDPAALAYTTAAVQRVVGTALSGGSGQQAYAALESTLDAYGSVKFKEVLDGFNIQEVIGKTLDVLGGNYQDVETAATNYNTIGLRRQGDAKEYEDKRLELQTELDAINAEKTRILGLPTETAAQRSTYNADVKALNTRIGDWVKLRDQYQPRMKVLADNVKRDTGLLTTAKTDLETAYGALYSTTTTLDTELKPLNDGFLEAITLTLDPVFNEDGYRDLNNLGEDENVYEHFLTQGQYEDVYTNYDQFYTARDVNTSALMNKIFTESGIDPNSLSSNQLASLHYEIGEIYGRPQDIKAAINDESAVANFVDILETNVAQDVDNPYRDATLTPELRSRLSGLGFVFGLEDEGVLSNEAKAALYAQDNRGQSVAGLAPGTTWEDVAAGRAVISYDDVGSHEWVPVEGYLNQGRWDPEYGRVEEELAIVISPDGNRDYVASTTDADGNQIDSTSYGINSSYTLSDALYALTQSNSTKSQISSTLSGNSTVQTAGEQLGGVDSAIGLLTTVIDLAESTGNTELINTVANVYKAGGGIIQAFNGLVTLVNEVPSETKVGQFADKLVKLGESSNTEEYKANVAELNELMNRPSRLDPDAPWYERAFEKMENIAGAISEQPTAFLTEYIGVEAVQELVPLAVGGVATLGARGAAMALGRTLSTRMAATTGLSAAATSDIAESYGGTAAETYDRAYEVAIKNGMPPAEAQDYAMKLSVKAGTVAATMTAINLRAGGLAIEKAILGKDEVGGFLARGIDELKSRISNGGKITIREGVTESIEEGAATAYRESHLAQIDPTINVSGETAGAALLGFLVGGPIAGGAYGVQQTGDAYSNVMAMFNPQVNAIVTNTPNTAEGVQSAADSLSELGFTGTTQTNLLNSINDAGYTSTQEAQSAFISANSDYQVTQDEINQFTVAGDEAETSQAVIDYIDPRYVDTQEVIETAAEQGLTITEEQAAEYVGQQDEASTLNEAAQAYDPLATTAEEAQSAFAEAGYNPTDAETSQFVMEGNEAEILSGIEPYVDPRQVTTEEAQSFFDELGYTPTEEEVANLVGQGDENFEATTSDDVGSYVDPRQITEEEVRAAYADAGLEETTQADIDRFIGQFDPETADYDAGDFQSVIESDIGEYLPTASSNILREYVGAPSIVDDPNTEIDESRQATGLFAELESAQGAVDQLSTDFDLAIGDTQQQITDLGTDLSEDISGVETALGSQISGVETALGSQITALDTDLSTDIQSVAELVGKPAQDVTQADIDFVADVIAQNQVITEQQITQYDVTGDGIVDINDQTLLEQALGDSTVDLASTSQFASTGIYGQLDTNQQQAMDAIQQLETNQDLTMQQNQEQTMDRLQQIEQSFITNIEDQAMREGGRNFLQMALQAPDAAGQQVSVKTPDPLNLGYIYDFSSIFANPSQQALFPTPYAKGGRVDSTTDRLLQIIGDS